MIIAIFYVFEFHITNFNNDEQQQGQPATRDETRIIGGNLTSVVDVYDLRFSRHNPNLLVEWAFHVHNPKLRTEETENQMKLEGNKKASKNLFFLIFLCIFFCFYLLFKKTRFSVFFFCFMWTALAYHISDEFFMWTFSCVRSALRTEQQKGKQYWRWKQFFHFSNYFISKKIESKSIWCRQKKKWFNKKVKLKQENEKLKNSYLHYIHNQHFCSL